MTLILRQVDNNCGRWQDSLHPAAPARGKPGPPFDSHSSEAHGAPSILLRSPWEQLIRGPASPRIRRMACLYVTPDLGLTPPCSRQPGHGVSAVSDYNSGSCRCEAKPTRSQSVLPRVDSTCSNGGIDAWTVWKTEGILEDIWASGSGIALLLCDVGQGINCSGPQFLFFKNK